MNFDKMRAFQEKLAAWRIPGNDCLIQQDHRELYRYCTGWADQEHGRAMDGSELYFFWSASKLITVSLALRLHEEGKFLMNEPLSDYLPEFRDMTVRVKIDGRDELVPAKKPILVKQLFNMTAGFDYNYNTPAINEVRRATDGKCPTREVARAIAQSPLCFEPGEHWQYSLCHDVLGAFTEVVAGKKLRDYAKEVLFDPLGMEDTTYNLPSADKLARMAVQYNFRNDLDRYVPTNNTCSHILGSEYDSGGAGVISTCADYAKFADTLACGGLAANGYRYLCPATIDLWRMNTLGETQMRDFNGSDVAGYGYGYGVRTMMDPSAAGSLSPVGEFGWGGAAGVYVVIDPANRLSLVYTMHMLNHPYAYFSPRMRNILYACME